MLQVLPNARTESRASRIFDAPIPLRLWHLASLDAPTVAVVWSLAFAWAAHVRLPRWVPLLLALTVWSVYVIDRLLDMRAGPRSPALHALRDRHYFHWRNRRILLPMAVAAACAALGIVIALMPPIVLERDSLLAVAALAYFSGVHSGHNPERSAMNFTRAFPSKEFLVGVLFTAGCLLPALTRFHPTGPTHSPLWPLSIPAACFAALAWLNCSSIAHWESNDAPLASLSCVTHRDRSSWLQAQSANFISAVLLGFAALLLALLAAESHPRSAALLIAAAASALLLALLDAARNRISPLALRAAADLVLLTPLLLLL